MTHNCTSILGWEGSYFDEEGLAVPNWAGGGGGSYSDVRVISVQRGKGVNLIVRGQAVLYWRGTYSVTVIAVYVRRVKLNCGRASNSILWVDTQMWR